MAFKKTRKGPEATGERRSSPYDTYAEGFSAKVDKLLAAGTAPWQKLWVAGVPMHGSDGMPYNGVSGKGYSGSNSLMLSIEQFRCGYTQSRWYTHNQATAVGGRVRKGARGTPLVKWIENKKKAGREEGLDSKERDTRNMYPVMFVVFNADQIDGLPAVRERKMPTEHERHEKCEQLLTDSGAVIRHDGGDNAFYRPGTDTIHLPKREAFKTPDALYATALHELGHWSGAKGRLDRDLTGRFGSIEYAREELVAEISSWMVGDRLGIGHDPGHHASYVDHWRQIIKDDPKAILKACTQAERVCEFIGVAKYEHEPEMVQEQERKKEAQRANEKSADWSPRRKNERSQEPALGQGHERDRGMAMNM